MDRDKLPKVVDGWVVTVPGARGWVRKAGETSERFRLKILLRGGHRLSHLREKPCERVTGG